MGKKYIVRYDREGCIGAGACVGMAPKDWEINPSDGKADLLQGTQDSSDKFFVREIDESELEAHLSAAKACPVVVIHVFEKDTGTQLI